MRHVVAKLPLPAGCGGLVWLHVVCGCEAGWMYCEILWNAFGDSLW